MKVILVAVTSIDGKTTKWGDPNIYKWTSKEDHDQFFSLVASHNLIIMGSKTYTAAKSVLKLAPEKMTLVMTRTPEKYSHETIPGQLEFTDESASELVEKFRDKYDELLLTGGAETNLLFLKEKLVDEIILTLEPHLFANGTSLVANEKLDINLTLLSMEKLNEQGTLLLRYKVMA